MDPWEFAAGAGRPSPRREIQGPRPTPLRVSKDSHKVKKPPLAPQPPQHRPPVIIYTVSPKVIHTNPSEFMSLVQRLTGPSSSSSTAAAESVSPAARFATIESTRQASAPAARCNDDDMLDQLGFFGVANLDRPGLAPNGVLSPVPGSLLQISPSFFSPPVVDTTRNSLSFIHQLSPAPTIHSNYVDNTFLVSPSNLLATPMVPSPGAYWDLFSQYQDI